MHRDRVHDQAGQHGERSKAQQQAPGEPRAEDTCAVAPRQSGQLIDHQSAEQQGEGGVQPEKQRILLREEGGIAARGREEEKPYRGDAAADDQQELHRPLA